MSNTKSGFEIRADLLNLAEGIININQQRKIDAVFNHNDIDPENKQELPVEEITAADIVAVATELNEFVNSK